MDRNDYKVIIMIADELVSNFRDYLISNRVFGNVFEGKPAILRTLDAGITAMMIHRNRQLATSNDWLIDVDPGAGE